MMGAMALTMDLAQRQAMSIDDRLALLERDVRNVQVTLDVLLNYVQGLADGLGLRERMRKLDVEIDELRSGGWASDPDKPTDPAASEIPPSAGGR